MLDIDCQESIGGDFLNSCINVIIKEYNSTDENAPSMCKVTADCKTMFEGLPNKQNEAYLPTQVINIDNKNWFRDVVVKAKSLQNRNYVPSNEAINMFDQKRSIKKVVQSHY